MFHYPAITSWVFLPLHSYNASSLFFIILYLPLHDLKICFLQIIQLSCKNILSFEELWNVTCAFVIFVYKDLTLPWLVSSTRYFLPHSNIYLYTHKQVRPSLTLIKIYRYNLLSLFCYFAMWLQSWPIFSLYLRCTPWLFNRYPSFIESCVMRRKP